MPLGVIVVGVFLLALLASGCDQTKAPTGPDPSSVLVQVGESDITYGEFRDALKRLLPEEDEEIAEEELAELKKSLLNQLIEERLILQEAEKSGIEISDEDIALETEVLKEDFEGDKFDEAIVASYGSMEKWQEELRKKLIIKKAVETIVNSKVTVTTKDALSYYRANKKEYQIPEQVHARMIVVETEEQAKEIRRKVFEGKFEDVAKEYSKGPEAESGGDLGSFGRGDMPLEFEEAVFGLPAGRISQVIKTPYGFHIFKVVSKTKSRKLTFSASKDSIMEKLVRDKTDEEYRNWVTSLKKSATIHIEKDLL